MILACPTLRANEAIELGTICCPHDASGKVHFPAPLLPLKGPSFPIHPLLCSTLPSTRFFVLERIPKKQQRQK